MSSSAAVIVSPEKISSLSDQQSCPKVCTCLDTHVDCSHRHLQTIPVPIPTWATTLELQGNALIAINRTVFIGLSKLNTLDISENGIQSFSRMVFAHIPYLRTLILRKNRLSAVPIGIEFLDSLVRLDLRSNMIKKLSVIDVQRLARISYVDLGRNQLTEWPNASIIDMLNCKIVKLDLSNNALTTLRTDTFSNLRSLQVLKLSRNKISRIESGAFRGMTALHSLNLARNRISSIDRFSFEMLVSLENLTLSRNSVSFIEDASFWSLEKLRRLDLSGNRLKSITRGWMYGLRFLIAM
ncbi:hypothetical protein AB6A40_009872 [Gnathostoma spinigerum]|uniref:LRRNT domain-containing protein n=1 Tax=Gnathostoma spinigerum TaxID=75299 RepID=A0ABD6ETL5_9BILA